MSRSQHGGNVGTNSFSFTRDLFGWTRTAWFSNRRRNSSALRGASKTIFGMLHRVVYRLALKSGVHPPSNASAAHSPFWSIHWPLGATAPCEVAKHLHKIAAVAKMTGCVSHLAPWARSSLTRTPMLFAKTPGNWLKYCRLLKQKVT